MDDETQFCLKWHNHQSTLIRNFDTLLESGTLVDCTLAAEGRYLKAHKVVLSACSPYFEGLLSEHYDKHPVFILKDVKFVELKAMMDYMYRGEVNISQNQLTALLKAAESLQIKGLSDSKTTGSSNNSTVAGRVEPKSTATSTSNAVTTAVDIPQGSSGLTIEKNNKVPRQRLTQTSANMSEGGASPQQVRGISSREGSVSPTRKRRARRRSLGNDESNSMENHEASNSSDVTASATVMAAPTVEDKSHAESADPIGRSALMQQLTKSNDDMLQMQMEKPEPNEDMIQPKSEYMEDQESVEDLTHLDDDMNDLNEMEQDNSRAGPSHDSSHPGLASWHIASDRSNAGVGAAGGAPGAEDAVFMNAHEPNAAQRDSQGQNKTSNQAGKVFSCPQCQTKNYKSQPCLKRHLKLECQKDPTFTCTICEKKFHQKCNLKRHMDVHNKGAKGNAESTNQNSCNDKKVSKPQEKITPTKKPTRRSSTEHSPPKKSSPNNISTKKTPRKKNSPRRYSKEKTPPQKTFAGKTSPKTISSEKIYSQVNSALVSQSATGMIPSGVIPPGMIQVVPGMIPTGMIPTGMIPPGMFPAGMIPPGMNSSGVSFRWFPHRQSESNV